MLTVAAAKSPFVSVVELAREREEVSEFITELEVSEVDELTSWYS